MAFTAATAPATVLITRNALIAALKSLELYMRVYNPGSLAETDALLTAAKTAITNVQA